MDSTDNLLKAVNENSDLVRIAEYILEFTKNYFSFEEAKKIAKFLLSEYNFQKSDILNGLANDTIESITQYKKMIEQSVQDKEKKESKVPLKTKKKKLQPRVIASSLLLILGIVAAVKINGIIQTEREDTQISSLIGMVADDHVLTTERVEQPSIVAQNSQVIDNGQERVVMYNNGGIAFDILDVCMKNPALLDIVLYRTYFDMEYNRLANMDEVIDKLKIWSGQDEKFKSVNDSLSNCSSFIDYVFKKGYISPNDPNYYNYREAVIAYNTAKSESKYAYNDLSLDAQKTIDKLISEYKKGRESLYPKFIDDLTELVEPIDGFNEGGRK